jgi:hypothetical protein
VRLLKFSSSFTRLSCWVGRTAGGGARRRAPAGDNVTLRISLKVGALAKCVGVGAGVGGKLYVGGGGVEGGRRGGRGGGGGGGGGGTDGLISGKGGGGSTLVSFWVRSPKARSIGGTAL